jgi:hypothetical protein
LQGLLSLWFSQGGLSCAANHIRATAALWPGAFSTTGSAAALSSSSVTHAGVGWLEPL